MKAAFFVVMDHHGAAHYACNDRQGAAATASNFDGEDPSASPHTVVPVVPLVAVPRVAVSPSSNPPSGFSVWLGNEIIHWCEHRSQADDRAAKLRRAMRGKWRR